MDTGCLARKRKRKVSAGKCSAMHQIELSGHNYGQQIRAERALMSVAGSGRCPHPETATSGSVGGSRDRSCVHTEGDPAPLLLAIKSPNCHGKRMRMSNARFVSAHRGRRAKYMSYIFQLFSLHPSLVHNHKTLYSTDYFISICFHSETNGSSSNL